MAERDDGVTEDAEVELDVDVGTDAPVRNTGEPCTVDGDCTGPGGACWTSLSITIPSPLELSMPGGYCSSSCDGADPESCGAGAWCLDASPYGGPILCVKTCTDSSECRVSEGYDCANFLISTQDFCGPLLP